MRKKSAFISTHYSSVLKREENRFLPDTNVLLDVTPRPSRGGFRSKTTTKFALASPRFRRPFSARSARIRSTVSNHRMALFDDRAQGCHFIKPDRKRTPLRVALVLSLQLPARTRHAHETTTPGRVESRTRGIRDVHALFSVSGVSRHQRDGERYAVVVYGGRSRARRHTHAEIKSSLFFFRVDLTFFLLLSFGNNRKCVCISRRRLSDGRRRGSVRRAHVRDGLSGDDSRTTVFVSKREKHRAG